MTERDKLTHELLIKLAKRKANIQLDITRGEDPILVVTSLSGEELLVPATYVILEGWLVFSILELLDKSMVSTERSDGHDHEQHTGELNPKKLPFYKDL